METEKLQKRIDGCTDAQDMLAIARAYLSGNPVYDPVAAEAWLNKAIQTGDPVYAPQAMGLLAREILGKEQIFPDSEMEELRRRMEIAQGEEKQELEELLSLV